MSKPGQTAGTSAAHDREHTRPAGPAQVWPEWAIGQLRRAVCLADRITRRGERIALAPELYRTWFNPLLADSSATSEPGMARPLAGIYRSAHAGSAVRVLRDGLPTVDRQDAIGRDGWWRTWGEDWRPRQSRERSLRVMLTPRPGEVGGVVAAITGAMLGRPLPWMLACPTDARRLRRVGALVLHLPDPEAVSGDLLTRLGPMLHPATPPLCLPLAPGIALADNPDNGMTFGEHRCHLISLGLLGPRGRQAPLEAIASRFVEHGIDPAAPHLSR